MHYDLPNSLEFNDIVNIWHTAAVQARKLEKKISTLRQELAEARKNSIESKNLKEGLVNARIELENVRIEERSLSRKALVHIVIHQSVKHPV